MDRQPPSHPKKTCGQPAMRSRERKTEEEKGKEAETPVMPGWLGRVKQRRNRQDRKRDPEDSTAQHSTDRETNRA